jgi:large subunit ribosomal protein L3
MGGKRVSVKNLQVVKVDEENNLLYLKGAVPGHKDAYLAIRRAKKG